ncbi:MAG TPA: hypothetical protein VF752_16155 [Thermoleophilaceae bacterium]
MCHSRRWYEKRDESFERELRDLYDRARERPEKVTPVVEKESADEPTAEPEREDAPVLRS